jgi:hypothetical protein
MTNQPPDGDTVKVNKNSSHTVQKPITTRTLAGAVLVLLGAVLIGIVIREFRFRSAGHKQLAQAPKAVKPRDIPQTRQVMKVPEIQNTKEQLPVEENVVESEPPKPEPVSPPPTSIANNDSQRNIEVQPETAAALPDYQNPGGNDLLVKEQEGRAALGLIGYDPEADEVWIRIINDPSLSAHARQDLIEDLNEDGFSDPHNPALDELPMIKYRIRLIEDLMPYAMDKVNSDAFEEAHKDLVNMVNRLTRQY